MEKNIKKSNRILDYFISFLMGLLTCVIFFQILNRFIFHIPLSWTEEASRYTFVWLCLFGTVKAYKESTHIRISFLIRKLSQRKKCFINLIGHFCILLFSILLTWTGFIYVKSAMNRTWEFGPIPILPIYLALPIVGILLSYQSIKEIMNEINNLKILQK